MSDRRDRHPSLRQLDISFADWVATRLVADPAGRATAGRLAAAASFALHLKHTCLDLDLYRELHEPTLDELLDGLGPESVCALPETACAVAAHAGSGGDAGPATPLVRSADGRRLWLQKYFRFEQGVCSRVRQLAQARLPAVEVVTAGLDEGQCTAVQTALTRRLAVITGGPGTGKTWTVARIITLLLEADPTLRIEMAAPTGKAANRMMESLRSVLEGGTARGSRPDVATLPGKAHTLHSLLGIYRHTPKPRFDTHNRLPLDVLVVDEASMVDLPMMARILAALPDHGRLVLLGDRDQLASVEAGGVLAELCRGGPDSVYGAEDAPVAVLSTNHRSIQAINDLAQVVNAGQAPGEALLDNGIVRHVVENSPGAAPAWLEDATNHYQALVEKVAAHDSVVELLKFHGRFQLLCALRAGPAGVAGINARLERRFGGRHEHATGQPSRRELQAWYPGIPVMVTANDHERKLYNGDIGLVLPVREITDDEPGDDSPGPAGWVIDTEHGELRACFPGDSPRAIRFAQMPAFETAYALTVHKSQGSEYDKVVLVLPDDANQMNDHPVLTRELLYTGITRAAKALDIHAGPGVIQAMTNRRTVRMSGLGHRSSG
ncbi:exodeoxyribonuclease V subunit alpha [Marinihelvus fidelis]|nr:exodeoxyribonuclease V subunit alpha [Marinihelvus fidelis]